MSIHSDLSELLKAEIISPETADDIRAYYQKKKEQSGNRLFVVFGILGAILVGLGIILIIAHNWDGLSRTTKTFFAFLPMIIGQGICGYVLLKKMSSMAWRESATIFLFFSVGACISLIGQIYNIPGNLSSFLLTWMLLCLPLIYLMRSSATSLLYIIGISFYAAETGYWNYPAPESYLYWLLLLAALPHYYMLYKQQPTSNFMTFHNWAIPISVMFILGTVAKEVDEFMFVAYCSLFGLYYLIGNLEFFSQQKLINQGYTLIGSLGTIGLLLIVSFDWLWKELREMEIAFSDLILSPEFIATTIIFLLVLGLLYIQQKDKPLTSIKPIAPVFILFLGIFIIGLFSPISILLINLMIFALGILIILEGAKSVDLGMLNYGLLVITALIICRFFDVDLSFVIRGILFVLIGVGFFAANYWMLKKRNANG